MIESVTIKDFQSIEDVTIDFSPGFNVLVGPSNSGKSAVLRAIRGIVRNEISPAFVRNGTRKSSISLKIDGTVIEADRGKSLSTYRLDEEEFTKCGKDVPEPILDALSMNLVNGEDLNFQFQFDSPFLLASSGSQTAQVIGSLTNVTMLYHAIQEVNRRYLRASSELSIRLKDIESEKVKESQFSGLAQRQEVVSKLDSGLTKYKEIDAHLNTLMSLVSGVQKAQDSVPVIVELPDLDAEFVRYKELESTLAVLTSKINEVTAKESSISSWEASVLAIQEKLAEVADQFCPTCGQSLPDHS